MKIRRDFVTNSSSSSFILAFNKDKPIDAQLRESLSKFLKGEELEDALQIVKNISWETYPDDKALFLDFLEEELKFEAQFRLGFEKRLDNVFEYLKSDEFKVDAEKYVKEEETDVSNQLKNKIIVRSEVSDNDGELSSRLEHEIMPYLDISVKQISHH